jgi:4-hydroxy-tetrahydrodipicolinate reductase
MKIAIAGASGRMGRMLIETVLAAPDMQLAGALDRADSPALGLDPGQFAGHTTGLAISDDMEEVLERADALIDFTRPQATLAHLRAAQRRGTRMIVGTTGFDAVGKAALASAAEALPVVFAPNMSVGVNVTFKLLEIAARYLRDGYDIEIIEAHHRHKVDAPSGTALRMGEIIATELGRSLPEVAVYGREGVTGERDPATIGFATVRGGDIVGDHTVLFAGIGERIEIAHRSASRLSYAQGALRAARFLRDKTSGLFDMQDVLGLR